MDVNTDILVQDINLKFFLPAAGVLAILHVAIALQVLHRLLQRLFVKLRKNLWYCPVGGFLTQCKLPCMFGNHFRRNKMLGDTCKIHILLHQKII
jgi:hypothetical protein